MGIRQRISLAAVASQFYYHSDATCILCVLQATKSTSDEATSSEAKATSEAALNNSIEAAREMRGSREIRIQADAILVKPDLIHRPGQVVVRAGRVLECSGDCSLPADLELPSCILSAGLVNAHTHLEFSDLLQPFPPGSSFPAWIGDVIRHRRTIAEQHSNEECWRLRRLALQVGYQESHQAGVALLADMVTRPWSPSDLSREPDDENFSLDLVQPSFPLIARDTESAALCLQQLAGSPSVFAFPEMIGLDEDRFVEAATWAMQFARKSNAKGDLADYDQFHSPVLATGLSPHAPYSVHFPSVVKTLASEIARRQVTAMHVAESLDELEWLARGTGPFRDVFERLGVPADAPRASISEIIDWLATRKRALLIHGNYLNEAETEQVARAAISIVYCPRTHRHFAHREYPLRRFLDSKINVVLGTDSRASNPDLDLWNEVLAVRQSHPWVSPEWLYGAVTQRAAEALGVEVHFGSLQAGRVAFLNVSRLDESVPHRELLYELTTRPRPFTPLNNVIG